MVLGVGKDRSAAPRFGVYLDEDEVRWLNEIRAQYLTTFGRDITTTNIIRLAIANLQLLDDKELLKLLESQPHRRRRTP
jgi:hypothetical protein